MLVFKQTVLDFGETGEVLRGKIVQLQTPTSFDKYDKEEKLEIIQKLIDNYNVLKKEIENEY